MIAVCIIAGDTLKVADFDRRARRGGIRANRLTITSDNSQDVAE
jgi:hypothetical protein